MACWDILGQAARPAGGDAAGRPVRRGLRPLPRDLAGVARGDGAEGRRLPRRGVPAVPAQGRRRPGRGRRAHPGGRGPCSTRRTSRRRRQHRLAAAPGGPGRPGGPRRRRLHRAALRRPTRSACRSGARPTTRSSWTRRSTAWTSSCARRATCAMDVVNIKISKFGGLTQARQARDLCVSLGIAMTLEDSWGGDVTTAAIAHLAHSHADRASLHRDRLQQLRHRLQRRRGPAAQERPHGRLHVPGPRRDPARRPAPRPRRRRLLGKSPGVRSGFCPSGVRFVRTKSRPDPNRTDLTPTGQRRDLTPDPHLISGRDCSLG